MLTKTYEVQDKLLYDTGISDKSSHYDVANQITSYGTNANVSITHDNANNRYILYNNNKNTTGIVPIIGLTGEDNIRLMMEVYLDINESGLNAGFGFVNNSNVNCEVFNIGNLNTPIDIYESNDNLQSGTTTTRRVWSKLIVERTGKQLNIKLLNANGSTNVSTTYTMTMTPNQNTITGIAMYSAKSANSYIRNIIVEPL